MMFRNVTGFAVAVILMAAQPAWAEPSFDGLGQALALFALVSILYLALIIALITLAVTRKKRAFWMLAAAGVVVAFVLPALDSALLAWQERRVAGAEIRKPAPDLRDKQVLFINPTSECSRGLCAALMLLRDEAPMWGLTPEAVAGLDLGQPIDMTTAPLQRYVAEPDGFRSYFAQPAPADAVRPEFDYVIIAQRPFFRSRAGAVEEALRQMPSGTLLGDKLLLQALAAPLMDQMLDLGALDPDYLTFYVPRSAFAPPLFPENTTYGTSLTYEWREDRKDWFCGTEDLSDAQYECRRVLD
ncbi:hypothetical protein [Roseovarius sp. 2305UL8-3]|uniref:hypothetical protein n=1 Tax=Roseovarius conchicola TaxID=3121636 RepID=UPI003528411C